MVSLTYPKTEVYHCLLFLRLQKGVVLLKGYLSEEDQEDSILSQRLSLILSLTLNS